MTRKVLRIFSDVNRHPKMVKSGRQHNIYSLILHLAPANRSGYEVCPRRTEGCTIACLNTAGKHWKNADGSDRKQEARIARTKLFFEDRRQFMVRLVKELRLAKAYAERHGYGFGVRLNGTSDFPWETVKVCRAIDKKMVNLMGLFPDVPFYDYTKRINRSNLPPNYRLTFSRSENNDQECMRALESGVNVAVVFDTRRKEALPASFTMFGRTFPVIDGDESDWRYGDYDRPGGPFIIGLRAKGKATRDETGFVVKTMRKA